MDSPRNRSDRRRSPARDPRICKFFNTPEGCRFGDRCKFKHRNHIEYHHNEIKDVREMREKRENRVQQKRSPSPRRKDRNDNTLKTRKTTNRHRSPSPSHRKLERWSSGKPGPNKEDLTLPELIQMAGSEMLAICYNPRNDLYEHDMDFIARSCKKCGMRMGC